MSRPIIVFHDIETDEYTQREMNDAEFQDFTKEQEKQAIIAAEEASKATAKNELLKRLGITADEAALLLS